MEADIIKSPESLTNINTLKTVCSPFLFEKSVPPKK
jgi:hypothetical protein